MADLQRGREPAVLGIDLGTSEVKAALVSLDGRLLGLGRGAYPTDIGPDGRAEQDPRDWWTALAGAVRSVADVADVAAGAEVAGICCVGQGPTLVAADADGWPVRPALTWQDRRAGAGGYGLLPRMAWMAREDPGAIARSRWLLSSWDALGLLLTGTAVTSVQRHESVPSPAALETAGLPPDRVPGARPVGAPLGGLRTDRAAELGLRPGIPVVVGVNDGAASMLGAGLRLPGDAVDTGGTSGGLAIYADRPVQAGRSFLSPAPLEGRWVVGGAMAALGATVDWVRATLLDGRWTADELFEAAATIPAGADGLVMLPYLAGERAPVFDEDARGVLFGLTLAHGPAHIARAALEAAAYALRDVAEPLAAAGAPVRELHLTGRAVPGDLWARIKAGVLGVPAVIPRIPDTAVLGAAILAAAGTGGHADLEAAVAAMTAVDRRVVPDPADRERYDEAFARYRSLYPALRPVFHRSDG